MLNVVVWIDATALDDVFFSCFILLLPANRGLIAARRGVVPLHFVVGDIVDASLSRSLGEADPCTALE